MLRRAFILLLPMVVFGVGCPKAPDPSWPAIGAPVPPIEGTQHDGQPFQMADQTKQGAVILFFGYTFCPDVCPLTLLSLKRLLKVLPPERTEHLKILFVTVDPKRDTVDRLAEYLHSFGPQVIGVVPRDLDQLQRDLMLSIEMIPVETSTATDLYSVNHTATIFLIGPDGRLAQRFSHGTGVEDMRAPVLEAISKGVE